MDKADTKNSHDKFAQVALLTGRPLFWHVHNDDAILHAKAVHKLIKWCLDIPEGQLGVSSSEKGIVWKWLDAPSAQQWSDQTLESLEALGRMLPQLPHESLLLSDYNKFGCVFFAPFNADSFFTATCKHFESFPSGTEFCTAIKEWLEDIDLSNHSLFWSLVLINFSASRGNLVYTPMLALWSRYPAGGQWAPPLTDNSLKAQPELSLEDATSLLQEIIWQKVESVFTAIRQFCRLGLAEPEFAGHEAKPPVFYFCQYSNMPSGAKDLATKKILSLLTLVKTCLGSDDPFSSEVSGGTLEGDFVTLRGASITPEAYWPSYLMFPIAKAKSLTDRELEADLFFITDSLLFFEFIIPDAARDVYTDYEPLASREAKWGGTLDSLSTLTERVISFLPMITGRRLKNVYVEMSRLVPPLRQIQSSLEQVSGNVIQVQGMFDAYTDRTRNDWHMRFAYSSCVDAGFNDLQEAVLNAYPYQYLKQPLRSLRERNDQLSRSIEHFVEIVTSLLVQADRITRESLERWIRRLGVIAALAAPALALPQFIEFIGGVQLDQSTYPITSIAQNINPQYLHIVAGYLLSFVLFVLFVTSILFIVFWIFSWFPKKTEPFVLYIHDFEALVRKSTSHLDKPEALNQIDKEATGILVHLWAQIMDIKSVGGKPSLGAWLMLMHNHVKECLKTLDNSNGIRVHALRRILTGVRSFGLKYLSKILQGLISMATALEGWSSRAVSNDLREWLRQSKVFRYLTYLFDLTPDIIPLPRALCIYRYKARDFLGRTTVSDWAFQSSLRRVKFDKAAIQRLDAWLNIPHNQVVIHSMSIGDFVHFLEKNGVKAYPEKQAIQQWTGFIQ